MAVIKQLVRTQTIGKKLSGIRHSKITKGRSGREGVKLIEIIAIFKINSYHYII